MCAVVWLLIDNVECLYTNNLLAVIAEWLNTPRVWLCLSVCVSGLLSVCQIVPGCLPMGRTSVRVPGCISDCLDVFLCAWIGCLSVCLDVCLSVCLDGCLLVCLDVYMCAWMSICVPGCLYVCRDVCMCAWMFFLRAWMYMSLSVPGCLSVSVPGCLSVCLDIC